VFYITTPTLVLRLQLSMLSVEQMFYTIALVAPALDLVSGLSPAVGAAPE